MTNGLACGLFAIVFLAGCAARETSVSNTAFTQQQRAAVVQIMRDAMKNDPSILREAILVLQADNDRIVARAQRDAVTGHQEALFDPSDPYVGSANATATIVEFYDPRCPYCRELAPMLAAFVAKDGNARLVYKDLPILGPASELGSRALLAAGRQGKYEALRLALMHGPSEELTQASVRDAVLRLGIDWPRLLRDMDSAQIRDKLAANKQLARALGIEGTPTLVIGDKIVEGADMPTIAAAVANVRHDRSRDRSQATKPMTNAPRER